MSSSHGLSGDIYATNPTTGAQITRNDGAGSTRNCEDTCAVYTSKVCTTHGNIGQKSHTHMQLRQGKEGRKIHTNRTMVDKERKLDSRSDGETEHEDFNMIILWSGFTQIQILQGGYTIKTCQFEGQFFLD